MQLPDAIGTKALGDGMTLHYEVHRTDAENVTDLATGATLLYHEEEVFENGVVNLDLELVNNQNFTVLFWAQTDANDAFDCTDLTNVTIKTELKANQENYAAFSGVDFIKSGDQLAGREITLVRPVAQLNIATTKASLEAFDTDVTIKKSSVKLTGKLATSYNVATLSAGDAEDVEFTYSSQEKPAGNFKDGYPYVAMNYVAFVDTGGENVEVEYTIETSEGDITNTIGNVPLKPNYRTNILGNLITETSDYEVSLESVWGGADVEVEVWDGKFVTQPAYDEATSTWSVTKASELAWLAAAVNGEVAVTKAASHSFAGETVKLTENIDLGNFPWTPIGLTGDQAGFQGTFDGNGKTISNLYIDLTKTPKYQSAGLFGSARNALIKNFNVKNAVVKNITTSNSSGATTCGTAVVVASSQIDGVKIENINVTNAVVEGNRYCAVIAGWVDKSSIAGCTIDQCNVKATPDKLSGSYDNGDKVGGILGYDNDATSITGCNVYNTIVDAYRDFAGVAGVVRGELSYCKVNNLTLIQNPTNGYKSEQITTYGSFYSGAYSIKPSVESGNTATNVYISSSYPSSTEEFTNSLSNAEEGDAIVVSGTITTTNLNASGKNITIVGTTEDATIDASSQSSYIDASGVTFKNLTVKVASSKDSFHNTGFINGSTVFENCKFEGTVTAQIGDYVFNNCVFTNTNEGHYPAFVYAGKATYNNCTFEGVDRAAKVYNHGDDYNCAAVYNNCTFRASKVYKTAVEIDATYNVSGTPYLVEINNPTIVNMGVAEHYAVGADGICNLETSGKGLGIVTLDGKGYSVASTAAQLQALTNAGKDVTIELAQDITDAFTYTQNEGEDVVIAGNNKTMTGAINVTASTNADHAGMFVIKDLNFETNEKEKAFINSVETNHYPHITVSNCTFKGSGAGSNVVPVTLKSSKFCVIENCKADNVHSLLQNTSGWNLTIRNCEVTNAGRGISLGSCQEVLIENVKIQASDEKYGIRMDAAYAAMTTIKNCEISAFCPVVVRNASAAYKLVFDGTNTMTAANTDNLWCAIGTSEYEANGSLPTAATGAVTVTLNDAGLAASGVHGASNL